MKPSDKLRVYYMRREADIGGFFPLGQGTKSDLGYLLYALEPIWKELERRGYDPKTLVRFVVTECWLELGRGLRGGR